MLKVNSGFENLEGANKGQYDLVSMFPWSAGVGNKNSVSLGQIESVQQKEYVQKDPQS